MTHLRAIAAFRDWPLKEIRLANIVSKVLEYSDNTVRKLDTVSV